MNNIQKTSLQMLRIKEIAKAKGMNLSELATKMNVKPSTLSRTISGNPSLGTLKKIAKALKVDITELFQSNQTIDMLRDVCGNRFINEMVESEDGGEIELKHVASTTSKLVSKLVISGEEEFKKYIQELKKMVDEGNSDLHPVLINDVYSELF